jgi:ABC-2 type transport system ATP-binding protein
VSAPRELVTVNGVRKTFGSHIAVDDLSFTLRSGEIVGFLGPNGAGKTTTLRMLAGFLVPNRGTILIDSFDITSPSTAKKARSCIGYLPEGVPLYGEMRVREYLRFRAELKGAPFAKRQSQVDWALDRVRARDVENVRIDQLSKGYRQRVGLADAIVARPPILVLDEPTVGMDPNQIRDVRELLGELRQDHAILLSTHILPEVEALCDRVLVIHQGKLVLQGAPSAIKPSAAIVRMHAHVRGEKSIIDKVCEAAQSAHFHVQSAHDNIIAVTMEWADSECPRAIESWAAAVVGAGLGLQSLVVEKQRLEDVFAALTTTR